MTTILHVIVIDFKTNESWNMLNMHPSQLHWNDSLIYFFLSAILLIHYLIALDIKRHFT